MTLHETISYAVKGNAEAEQFLLGVHRVVELWDDLIDKDKPASDADINAAFYHALIVLPRNPFYQANFALLNSIFESAILDWHTANALETKKDEQSLRISHVLRCSIQNLTIMAARIVGGVDWAIKISLAICSAGTDWPDYAAKHGVT